MRSRIRACNFPRQKYVTKVRVFVIRQVGTGFPPPGAVSTRIRLPRRATRPGGCNEACCTAGREGGNSPVDGSSPDGLSFSGENRSAPTGEPGLKESPRQCGFVVRDGMLEPGNEMIRFERQVLQVA